MTTPPTTPYTARTSSSNGLSRPGSCRSPRCPSWGRLKENWGAWTPSADQEAVTVTRPPSARSSAPGPRGLAHVAGHLVEADRDRQDEQVVLPRRHLDPVGVAH